MTKVAAEFGLSDVAVKKLCRKFDVPTPPRGYGRNAPQDRRTGQQCVDDSHHLSLAFNVNLGSAMCGPRTARSGPWLFYSRAFDTC